MSVNYLEMKDDPQALGAANPFLLAMKYYAEDITWTIPSSRRLDSIMNTMKELLYYDGAEEANIFLDVLSCLVAKYYPNKTRVLLVDWNKIQSSEQSVYILSFASRSDTTEKEFLFILERAALLWVEVDGDTDEIPGLTEKPIETSTKSEVRVNAAPTVEDYEKCIAFVSQMLEVLSDWRVSILQSRYGVRIHMSAALVNDLFSTTAPCDMSIYEFIRDFPCPNGGWEFAFKQISQQIALLDMRPVVWFDNPVMDFADREDVDDELLILVLEETIKDCIEQKDKLEKPNTFTYDPQFDYSEYLGC